MLEVLLLYLIIPGGLISFNRVVMVALVNNAIGPSCLLPSGSGSNTADKNLPEQVTYTLMSWYLHVPCTRKETLQRLAKLCGCGYLLLQIHLCGWRTSKWDFM